MSAMAQLVSRVDDELAQAMDALVASGRFESRSEIVRVGVTELLDRVRRGDVGRQILDGYRRIPETDEELTDARVASIALIAEEPW